MMTNRNYPKERVDAFINLFKYAQQFYGQKMKNEFSFSMFYSEPPYADLIFQDAAQKLITIEEDERDYRTYLGNEFVKAFEEVDCSAASTKTSFTVALLFNLYIVFAML